MNPLIQVVIPFTTLAVSLITYLVCLFFVPLDSGGRPASEGGFGWANYKNGVIYTLNSQDGSVYLSDILKSKADDFTKVIDGKKYFFVPEKVGDKIVTGGFCVVPEDVDAIVYPKNFSHVSVSFYNIPTSDMEIYVYKPQQVQFYISTRDSEIQIDGEKNKDAFKFIKL